MRFMLAKNSISAVEIIKRYSVREYLTLLEIRVEEILARKQKKSGQNDND